MHIARAWPAVLLLLPAVLLVPRTTAGAAELQLGPRSELVLRAGERESDEHGEDDRAAGDPRDHLRDRQRTTTTARSGRIQG